MKNIFTEHPRSVGETYLQHFHNASSIGRLMLVGGIACFIHAIFPFVLEKTASNVLFNLMRFFVNRMPHVEERVVSLSECIERKVETSLVRHEII